MQCEAFALHFSLAFLISTISLKTYLQESLKVSNKYSSLGKAKQSKAKQSKAKQSKALHHALH
jgi:hypothetical protein